MKLQPTLEELLRQNADHTEYRMAVQQINDNKIHVIVHPNGINGETIDLVIKDNTITPLITVIGHDDEGSTQKSSKGE